MPTKFHINPDTGKSGACTASKRPCKYGEDTPHYASAADAQSAYEERMSNATIATHSRSTDALTTEDLDLVESRIVTARTTAAHVSSYAGELEKKASESTGHRKAVMGIAASKIDKALSESDFSTAEGSEKSLDRIEMLKDDLNRSGHLHDARGEDEAASAYWEASEGLADHVIDNKTR